MLDAKETYYRGKQIGRMFYKGTELKEVWFRGNRIFCLSDGEIVEIDLPSNVNGNRLMKMGGYIVLFSTDTSSKIIRFHRFKNGNYVDTVTIMGTSNTLAMVMNYTSFESHGFVTIFETLKDGSYKFWSYGGGDTARSIALSSDFAKASKNVSLNIGMYCNNRIFFAHKCWLSGQTSTDYPQFTSDEINHLKFASLSIIVNENKEPVSESIVTHYGIPMSTEIVRDVEYTLQTPIITNLMYDSGKGIYYAKLVTKYKINTRGYKYTTDNGYIVSFDGDVAVAGAKITDGTEGYASGTIITRVFTPSEKFGIYTHAGSKTYDGKKYNVLYRNYLPVVIQQFTGTQTSIDDDYIWCPGTFTTYDSVNNKYIIASQYNESEYEIYQGILSGTNIDDADKMYYEQEPVYNKIADVPEYKGMLGIESNPDGIYMFFFDSSANPQIRKLVYIPLQ